MQHLGQPVSAPGPDLLRGARAALGWSSVEAGRRAAVSAVVSAEGRSGASSSVPPSVARLAVRALSPRQPSISGTPLLRSA